MHAKKLIRPDIQMPGVVPVRQVPTGEGDFLPELHAARAMAASPRLFGEEMSKKNAHTADARQKRGH